MIAGTEFFDEVGDKPRDSQNKMIEFLNDNEEMDYFVIDAPTGCGKSHVGLSTKSSGRIYVLTATKYLQDQYLSIYPEAVAMKGKNNFRCGLGEQLSCENGYCSSFPKLRKSCKQRNICPYYAQLDRAISAEVFVANYDYFVYAVHCGSLSKKVYGSDAEWEADIKRKTLVCDEAHVLEGKLVSFAETEIDFEDLESRFGIPRPSGTFSAGEVQQNKLVISSVRQSVAEKMAQLSFEMQHILKKYEDQVQKTLFSLAGDGDPHIPKMSEEDEIKAGKLQNKIYDLDKIDKKLEVYFTNSVNNRWLQEVKSKTSIRLTPYNVSGLFKVYFVGMSDKTLMMSATIGDADEFSRELGLPRDKTATMSAESDFDPAKSPVIYAPVGKMNYGSIEETMPHAIKTIRQIMEKYHPGDKGIIHTANYKVAEAVYRGIGGSRILFRDSERGKSSNADMLKFHRDSKGPTVLVSPSMGEGVSLDDDLSRFQIIVKLPFASLGDYRTNIKKDDGSWYAHKMWVNLMQSAGRSTRSKDDYSVTYILDSSFLYFFKKGYLSLPGWFVDRVVL